MRQRWLGVALLSVILLMVAVSTGEASTGIDPVSDLTSATLCEQVYTGTIQSVYRICSTNPNLKIVGQEEAHFPNYDLWVNTVQPAQCITITVSSRLWLPHDADYPLQSGALPVDTLLYLEPEYLVQSDQPVIQDLAAQLAGRQDLEGDVISSIVAWLHGHITVAESGANDALGVLDAGAGSQRGYVNLAAALLRAAGIPTQVAVGGVTADTVLGMNWTTSSHGSAHYWLLVYYPDLGWIPSDPQRTVDFVDTTHLFTPFRNLMQSYVQVLRVSHFEAVTLNEQVAHSYTDTLVSDDPLYGAARVGGRQVLEWQPKTIFLALPRSQLSATVDIMVGSRRCDGAWTLVSSDPWLMPSSSSGIQPERVPLAIDVSALSIGYNRAQLTLSTASTDGLPVVTATIPVLVFVADPLYSINIPLVQ